MRVLILGSGVIGTTSAWYLAKAGCEVVVVDRQPGSGLETSYANAGQLSFGYTSPWAAPGIPLKAVQWLFERHAPLSIRPTCHWHQYLWLAHMLRHCTAKRYALNKSRMVRITEYSRESLDALSAETGIVFEGRRLGTTQLFRTQQQLDAAARDIEVLAQYGIPYEILSPDQIARFEPGLVDGGAGLAGALHLPNDQTGDCHLFTQRLAALAAGRGVEFRYGCTVQRLEVEGRRVVGAWIDGMLERADCCVVALGSYSPPLLVPLGLRLLVYPLKGFSLTLPIVDASRAPISTVLDESYKIAITRFDQRIRIGGMAEVAGYDLSLNGRRRATLEMVVQDLFCGGGDLARGEFWTGLRPATPDGTPVIGATPYAGLFLNTGHGTLGWTMSSGSGRYLADLICGRPGGIDGEGLDIFRYLPPTVCRP
ncbi:D-amino acid dehydrogenase [Xylella taiwanensis]|uniref:D-amino acid dehydrogenase n=1 Tax=Xylella taiwanensis TaxID=1444770 RepID=A0ABS8TRP1_9GAMM|nr:D-amino acid dehydrogenase [Xylella taiwanensis]AXI84458.1 amino acid dehydrogenase [Xylella taiwanensis]MCD8455353.1 D-amino acid dehydrogenase [Xylella taiwanensis]MCD8457757.1 D-amino acid dehydrogenase [Xylella taiwanensis]MCD8459892.1 D-amino acid dehydrogenase [Xylella taiwanensis]MCD8464046.1 D-amino acid dehydrogenase [Xylella taiwanensis]